MHDLFDGPVAKAAGTASVRGAFFDSVTDRIADAVLMFGCAWYLLDRGDGHLALLPMAILAVTAPRLLRAGQGGVARALGQGRPHGAGRAHVPARRRLPEHRHLRAGALDPASSSSRSPPSPASSRSGTPPRAATPSSGAASRPGARAGSTRAGGPGVRPRESTGVPRRELARTTGAPGGSLAGPPSGVVEQPIGPDAPRAPPCRTRALRQRRRAGPTRRTPPAS